MIYFLYAINEKLKFKTEKFLNTPLKIAPPHLKKLMYKSNETCTGSVYGNYKTLIKEIKDLIKWRYIPCSQIRRLNIVKMSVLPNLI